MIHKEVAPMQIVGYNTWEQDMPVAMLIRLEEHCRSRQGSAAHVQFLERVGP